jgi:hypothetical protein
MLKEFIVGDDVEHCLPGRHRKRIAAIGRSMGSDHHPGRCLLSRETGAQRESAANALRRGEDVGFDPIMLVSV